MPEDCTFSPGLGLGLGVGVAIGFTAALILATFGYVIVWLLRRKCRNQSGKYTHTSIRLSCYATTVIVGHITATQPVNELPSTQEHRGNTNNRSREIRTHPNPGYGVHHLEEIQSTVDDYDYI